MQEGTIASANNEQEGKMGSTEKGMDADIRRPSINTEPRTLDEMTLERAQIAAQKIYSDNPSEDFTKDALDTATRENAPAEDSGDANSFGNTAAKENAPAGDSGDANSLENNLDNVGYAVDTDSMPSKASVQTEAPVAPPPTPM